MHLPFTNNLIVLKNHFDALLLPLIEKFNYVIRKKLVLLLFSYPRLNQK